MDAGYLLAEGGKAYCGVRKRSLVTCEYPAVAEAIETFCADRHGLAVLRTYWYDGARDAVPTEDHLLVAGLPRVKLRLGRVAGTKQKGVDSLIVHDLITLAYARAVSSMYLLGGDEDLREGVAAAQRLGVQLSLLGIDTGEQNQALTLIHEADEHVLLPAGLLTPHFRRAGAREAAAAPVEPEPTLAERVRARGEEFARAWAAQAELAQIGELVARAPEIPRELDVQLLLRTEEQLGISLRGVTELRHALRAAFWSEIKKAAEASR